MKPDALGFNCTSCGKPFFVVINDAQAILDDAVAIKRYQKKGLKLSKIPSEIVRDITKWCMCKGGLIDD